MVDVHEKIVSGGDLLLTASVTSREEFGEAKVKMMDAIDAAVGRGFDLASSSGKRHDNGRTLQARMIKRGDV